MEFGRSIRRPAYNWKDVSSEGVTGIAKMREQSTDGLSVLDRIRRAFWDESAKSPHLRITDQVAMDLIRKSTPPVIVKDLSKPEGEE